MERKKWKYAVVAMMDLNGLSGAFECVARPTELPLSTVLLKTIKLFLFKNKLFFKTFNVVKMQT